MRIKIAAVIWWLCGVLDRIPVYSISERRWYRAGTLGCYPLRLSRLALRIEGGDR